MSHLFLAEAVATAVDEWRHLWRVDFVHLGAEENQGSSDFLIVVFIEDEAKLDQTPQIGDGEIECGFGDIDLPAEPHNPLGRTAPVPFLNGLDGRTGTVVLLLGQLEWGQGSSLVQLSMLGSEAWWVVVAHLHPISFDFNYILLDRSIRINSMLFSICRKVKPRI